MIFEKNTEKEEFEKFTNLLEKMLRDEGFMNEILNFDIHLKGNGFSKVQGSPGGILVALASFVRALKTEIPLTEEEIMVAVSYGLTDISDDEKN